MDSVLYLDDRRKEGTVLGSKAEDLQNLVEKRRSAWLLPGFAVLAVLCFFLSFLLGQYPVKADQVMRILLHHASGGRLFVPDWNVQTALVVIQIRLPRILLAALVGMALAVSGSTLQAVFRNPLVSPGVLGTSNGAAFGACLALLLGLPYYQISLMAFVFGILSMLLVMGLGSLLKTQKVLGLILCGILVSSLFSSGISLLKLTADPNNTLPAITYWLMGSFAGAKLREIPLLLPLVLGLTLVLLAFSWQLNVLTLPETEAQALGLSVRLYRYLLLGCATLLVALCVSVSGAIAWVGLVLPHLARMMVGHDYRRLLPLSALLGISFMLLTDNAARLIASSEIPIGIMTSFLGAPFYLYLILKSGREAA